MLEFRDARGRRAAPVMKWWMLACSLCSCNGSAALSKICAAHNSLTLQMASLWQPTEWLSLGNCELHAQARLQIMQKGAHRICAGSLPARCTEARGGCCGHLRA